MLFHKLNGVCIHFLRKELLRIALSKEKSVSSTNVFKLPKSHLLKGIKERSCLPEINLGDDGMKPRDKVHLTK